MNRKSPSLAVRIRLNYIKLILRGIKIIEEKERYFLFYNKKIYIATYTISRERLQ